MNEGKDPIFILVCKDENCPMSDVYLRHEKIDTFHKNYSSMSNIKYLHNSPCDNCDKLARAYEMVKDNEDSMNLLRLIVALIERDHPIDSDRCSPW